MIKLELTDAQLDQLVISLRNDWMDNEVRSQRLIERILAKLGYDA
jgi:hypothetical protein